MLESQWVWQCTKSVSIPAEEQNAGLIVDYFYRMEFHITPRFFSDSNYLFLKKPLFPVQNPPSPMRRVGHHVFRNIFAGTSFARPLHTQQQSPPLPHSIDKRIEDGMWQVLNEASESEGASRALQAARRYLKEAQKDLIREGEGEEGEGGVVPLPASFSLAVRTAAVAGAAEIVDSLLIDAVQGGHTPLLPVCYVELLRTHFRLCDVVWFVDVFLQAHGVHTEEMPVAVLEVLLETAGRQRDEAGCVRIYELLRDTTRSEAVMARSEGVLLSCIASSRALSFLRRGGEVAVEEEEEEEEGAADCFELMATPALLAMRGGHRMAEGDVVLVLKCCVAVLEEGGGGDGTQGEAEGESAPLTAAFTLLSEVGFYLKGVGGVGGGGGDGEGTVCIPPPCAALLIRGFEAAGVPELAEEVRGVGVGQ